MNVENHESSKPRLLIILNRFVIGGQAVDTLPLAYFLQPDFKILIIYGEKEKDEIEPDFLLKKYAGLNLQKISHLRRSINPLIDIIAFFRLLKTIGNFKADIVHTHGAKSGFLGRLAAFVCGVPVIVHTFHGHFFHSYFSKTISSLIAFVERMMAKITTAAVALSDSQKHELVNVFKILPASKLQIIPLGFDINEEGDNHEYRNTFRSSYRLDEDHVAIGIVGRIVPVKNHLLFLQVVQKILNEYAHLKVVFFIIGDGDITQQLQQWLQQKQLDFSEEDSEVFKKIIFTSWITNVEEIMNGLDIIALTSLNEGTPLTLIEAQFYKKPIVATNVGGVKDTMQDNLTGYLVASEDAAAFTNKLVTLIEDRQLCADMGKAGHELVINRFSKKKEVAACKQFYFNLLKVKQF